MYFLASSYLMLTFSFWLGDIVVALIGDNENTLKRFGGLDEEGYAILEYQNEEVYPEKIIRVRDLIVQGVAKHVIRSL